MLQVWGPRDGTGGGRRQRAAAAADGAVTAEETRQKHGMIRIQALIGVVHLPFLYLQKHLAT